MKYYIVGMPDNWDKDTPIDDCPLLEHGCGEFGLCTRGCPLANAKEAVEVKYTDISSGWGKDEKMVAKVNKNPVTLYAVKREEV